MNTWLFTPLVLPQVLAAVFCVATIVFVGRRERSNRLASHLQFMLAAGALWAGAGALEFMAKPLWLKILLSQVSYFGIVLGPIALLRFTHAYLGDGASPPRLLQGAAVALAVLILIGVWTNPWLNLVWSDVVPVTRYGHPFARYERAVGFWVTVVYCYGLMLYCSLMLIRHTLRLGGIFSRQSVLILAATLAPWTTSAAYVLRLGAAPELDQTPVGFAVSALLLALGVIRLRLFEIGPVPADTLFARIPDPVLVVDWDDRLLRANAAAMDRLGISPRRLGEPLSRVLVGQPELCWLLQSHPGRTDWQLTGQAEGAWWEIESGAVDQGATTRLVLLRDITERKRAELRLAQALERAEELRREADAANAAKSLFLAQVSHDLRTPLHAILGISELLYARQKDEKVRADAATIREAGQILLRLINDLLDLSRIEAGRVDLVHEPFRLEELVLPVVELLQVKARAKGIGLEHRIAPGVPPALCGDLDRLRQILFNLVGNAVKFTQHGSVVLRLEVRDMVLGIAVVDTGPGIPADRLSSLFEPFDRGDRRAVRRIEGSGLGLAIARRLARAMGGDITVESSAGRGSVFTVRLPLREAHAPADQLGLRLLTEPLPPSKTQELVLATECAAESVEKSHAPSWRVLLADDQEISRRVSSALLRACGCEVTEVADGPEALHRLRLERHDVAVLDGQMGKMDGWEVAHRIRAGEAGEGNRGMALIALTADLSGEARSLWQTAGVDAILAKPSSVKLLCAALARLRRPEAPAEG